MGIAPEGSLVAIRGRGDEVIGEITRSVVVSEGSRRWLELGGITHGVRWSASIPIAAGWTLVKLPEEAPK